MKRPAYALAAVLALLASFSWTLTRAGFINTRAVPGGTTPLPDPDEKARRPNQPPPTGPPTGVNRFESLPSASYTIRPSSPKGTP
jgi:hypothetical protein